MALVHKGIARFFVKRLMLSRWCVRIVEKENGRTLGTGYFGELGEWPITMRRVALGNRRRGGAEQNRATHPWCMTGVI